MTKAADVITAKPSKYVARPLVGLVRKQRHTHSNYKLPTTPSNSTEILIAREIFF